MYKLVFLDTFWKNYKKLVKGNQIAKKQIQKTLEEIMDDPFYPSLKTHKVDTKRYSEVYSSWVTGNIRIIWSFDENQNLQILVLEIGTHSGSTQVYTRKS